MGVLGGWGGVRAAEEAVGMAPGPGEDNGLRPGKQGSDLFLSLIHI